MVWVSDHVYVLAFVVAFIDATALPVPGRLILVVFGAVAGRGDASVTAVVLLAAAGAFAGDHVWYALGRFTGGGPLDFVCRAAGRARHRCERQSLEYYDRYGAPAIVLGRFFAGVRIAVTPLAARGTIPYVRYAAYEALGALVWAAVFVLLGWALGDQAVRWVENIGWVTLTVVGVLAGLLALPFGYRWWRGRLARSG